MPRQYYYLVAGLKEYFLDSDTKGFDAPSIVEEIKEGVSRRDKETIELLYGWYDIENIIKLRSGREHFSTLGNFSREELSEWLSNLGTVSKHTSGDHSAAVCLPRYIAKVVEVYSGAEEGPAGASLSGVSLSGAGALTASNTAANVADSRSDTAGVDTGVAFGRSLFESYYMECARSRSKFLREWGEFDRTLRNISAAVAARRMGIPTADVLVGGGDVAQALGRSSAADFGLKGEVDYIDRIMVAIADGSNMIDKEYRVDAIRWERASEISERSYFDIDFLLGYLVKVNIIHRWASLDRERGEQMLRRLIDELTGSEVIGKAGIEVKAEQ